MPKAPRKKYYAVRVGREGPKIYDTWEEVGCGLVWSYSSDVSRWPRAIFKSFTCRADAEQWVSIPHRLELTRTHNNLPEPPSKRDAPDSLTEHVPADGAPSSVVLSEEQRTVLEMVQRGENVFFTGSAGRKYGFSSPV
ncbi:hypothetical protein HD554DRAFT_2014267 [Boletus coccyginus]|nr:hypothetical protein HD554DRAFT_2014267 [Boletus coccyginus]